MKLPSQTHNAKTALNVSNKAFFQRLSKYVGLIVTLASLIFTVSASAADINRAALNDNYPERYTVVKGDTLWGISGKFLRDVWRWPEIWQGNPKVENPDLIYPGDVLVLTFLNGRPVLKALRRETVKVSPSARATSSRSGIPLIDPAAISSYLTAPLVTNEQELKSAPYIVDGFNKRIVLGRDDQFYARGVEGEPGDAFKIFRPGRHFRDPVTNESLGYEAVHIGDSNLMKGGDPARLLIGKSYTDVNMRDRLRPMPKAEALPFFAPKAPEDKGIRGAILDTENEATELGALSIVAISVGEREGVEAGSVLRIKSKKIKRKDPMNGETFYIPEENVGLLMVFRTFEKVSYAIITDSSRQVAPGDSVVHPGLD
jgi:hypothetical protein